MFKKIEYENKIAMQNDESIPTKGKVTDDDMNEIKEVVNNNADELENKQPKEEGKGLSEENFTTQLKQKLEDLENFDDKVILQKIENLTKKQTEQNSKIAILEEDSNINKTKVEKLETSDKLQTDDIKLLQQENQQIKIQLEETNNLLPKGKFEGEEVTITDSAEHTFKELTIEGNSWQETNEKMPSPEYPSRIRNVGDNINLFNKDGNVIYSYDSKLEPIETGVKVTLKIVGTSRYCVMKLGGSELLGKKLVAHGNVVISGQNDGIIGIYFGTDNNFTINWIADTGILEKNIKDFNRVLTIPDTFPEGCNSIYIIFYANGISTEAQVEDYVEYRNLKIEEGTQATSYSPYNCGNVNFSITNANLAKINDLKGNISEYKMIYGIPVHTGDTITYMVDFVANNTNSMIPRIYEDEILTKIVKSYPSIPINKKTIEITNDGYFSFAQDYGIKDMTINKMFVGKGRINETDFVEQQEQNFVFPLKEGQVLHKGDFLAEDGVHHKRKQFELDGINLKVNVAKFNNGLYYCTVEVPFLSIKDSYGCSTHFNFINRGLVEINKCYVTNNGLTLVFVLENQNITTAEDTNNWALQQKEKGTPVKFECELAKEVIEPYTEEQQNVYNQIIKTAKTYKGTTHIFSQDEISPVFKGQYFKDLEILLSNQTGGGN